MIDAHLETILAEQPHRVKPLLYTYRVLLTGIHLMCTGEVEANLVHLNELFKLPYIPDLIAHKFFSTLKRVEKGCTSYRLQKESI